ncbi:hypothetical protein LKMONMHP_3770 [Methylobacterium organophilum]|uniref:Uncharacterized protein n=1 Tax=Methylobacterium organophilum TaxID=410 RepID=A0ABQ4TEP2_METOR|nr:hypothetical protein LKMONMHP_3770 [Methylobacterium organophilum]
MLKVLTRGVALVIGGQEYRYRLLRDLPSSLFDSVVRNMWS